MSPTEGNQEPKPLERRIFTCPDCGRKFNYEIFMRVKPFILDCSNDCFSLFYWDWETGNLWRYPEGKKIPNPQKVFSRID